LRAIGKRLLALVVGCVASSILAGPAGAQGKPDSTGFIGIPEYTSSETGIPFFVSSNANRVDTAFRDMRTAIAKCNRRAYDDAENGLFVTGPSSADDPTASRQVLVLRLQRDDTSMREARGKAPPYPVDCTPPKGTRLGATGNSTDVRVIGSIPQYTSTETGISFYFNGYRDLVDSAFKRMREAIQNCDRNAYQIALHNIADQLGKGGNDLQSKADDQFLTDAVNQAPFFPEPCGLRSTGSKFGYFELVAIGGGMIPLNGAGAVTGVDTFFGSGAYQIDNRSSTAANATAFGGLRARALTSPGWMKELAAEETDRSAMCQALCVKPFDSFRLFAETGIQTAFGAQSSLQTFQNVSGTPQAFGSSTINENLQIPILVGVTVPIVPGGAGKPAVSFDLYGGITLDSWTQTLQGRESGAPGGPGFFGQNRRFTVDPTIGVGVRVPVGDFAGLPGITVGVNAELQFRPGSVVTAPSTNFPSETYYGTVNPTANMAIMGRVGIPFSGR
jgi:hypothetical protein